MPVSLPPAKRRKTEHESKTTESIRSLEAQLGAAVAANSSLNPLADFLDLAYTVQEPDLLLKAIYGLYRTFVLILTRGKLRSGGDEAGKIVRKWIWERLDSYVDLLTSLLQDKEATLRKSSLEILFSLLKHLSTSLTKSLPKSAPQIHSSHFKKIARGLLICPSSLRLGSKRSDDDGLLRPDVRDAFVDTWFSVFDDVRWCFLRDAHVILSTSMPIDYPHLPANLLSVLEKLTTFPTEASEINAWWVEELGVRPPKPKNFKLSADNEEDETPDNSDNDDDWKKFFDEDANAKTTKSAGIKGRLHSLTFHQSLHSLQAHRAVFTRTWLTLLPHLSSGSLDTRTKLTTRALTVMHRGVMPHLTRPILIMDWVSSCVDYGGTVGLLALNALFMLIKDYNLDYPLFYTRLYAFLDRDVLHLKHRARFFRMAELFLSSTHLPATLLASFVKRLSRLSLAAPPAAIIMIIPFTYNILKRHPALMVMIHRTDETDDLDEDPFLAHERNPSVTDALNSSLWELYTHRHHYVSAVSTLARLFEQAFTKPGFSMEDFLDHTYGTLIDAQLKHRIKNEPALAIELKQNLFPIHREEINDSEDQPDAADIVAKLWSFS